MKIYISGKIGEDVISLATRDKFAAVEHALKTSYGAKGEAIEVVNPASETFQRQLQQWLEEDRKDCLQHQRPWNRLSRLMLYDLDRLQNCDMVLMLPDWTISDGARIERQYAKYCGIPVRFTSAGHAYNAALNAFWTKPGTRNAEPSEADAYARSHFRDYIVELPELSPYSLPFLTGHIL